MSDKKHEYFVCLAGCKITLPGKRGLLINPLSQTDDFHSARGLKHAESKSEERSTVPSTDESPAHILESTFLTLWRGLIRKNRDKRDMIPIPKCSIFTPLSDKKVKEKKNFLTRHQNLKPPKEQLWRKVMRGQRPEKIRGVDP